MKRFLIIVGIFIVLGAIAGVIVWKQATKQQDKSVHAQKADISIAADVLVKDFETSEANANAKYLGKIIVVKGVVDGLVENDKEYTVTMQESGNMHGVACGFDKTTVEKDKLKIGAVISVKGVCSGYLMDVVLNRCSLE